MKCFALCFRHGEALFHLTGFHSAEGLKRDRVSIYWTSFDSQGHLLGLEGKRDL